MRSNVDIGIAVTWKQPQSSNPPGKSPKERPIKPQDTLKDKNKAAHPQAHDNISVQNGFKDKTIVTGAQASDDTRWIEHELSEYVFNTHPELS